MASGRCVYTGAMTGWRRASDDAPACTAGAIKRSMPEGTDEERAAKRAALADPGVYRTDHHGPSKAEVTKAKKTAEQPAPAQK